MTPATTLILFATLALSAGPPESLIQRGADPARGLLVNRTWGARPFDPPDASRPTVVFIHGFNPAPRLVHFEMATRLGESVARRGVGCNVLDWDWNAATCDSLNPKTNSLNSVEQGRLLAQELNRQGIDPARTHLIGHSAGGIVATSAAQVFSEQWRRPVAQLTLLEPARFYHPLIFERLQAGSLAPVVENYWTSSPSAYGKEVRATGVRDYHVEGRAHYYGILRPTRSDHVSIVNWYLSSVENPATNSGFNTNQWIYRP